MMIKIPLPEKVSLNAIYKGIFWRKRKEIADLYHQQFLEFRNHKDKPIIFPVEIFFIFYFKGKLLDADNCGFMAKCCIDGMIANKILPGDDPKYVYGVHYYVKKGKKDEVVITM